MNIVNWWNTHKGKKEQWMIPALLGLLLLVIALPQNSADVSSKEDEDLENIQTCSGDEYVADLEQRLEAILEQMEGVGKTKVMITLAASTEKIIEKDVDIRNSVSNSENENNATNENSETTIYSSLSDGDVPYVKQEISPVIEGVLVVAEGGDLAVVKQNITEVIQALFGIDTHKIRVMKHN